MLRVKVSALRLELGIISGPLSQENDFITLYMYKPVNGHDIVTTCWFNDV